MLCHVLSTAAVPEHDRFAYWCEAVSDIGIPGRRDRPAQGPFEGRLVATIGSPLARFRFRSSGYRVCRIGDNAARPRVALP